MYKTANAYVYYEILYISDVSVTMSCYFNLFREQLFMKQVPSNIFFSV